MSSLLDLASEIATQAGALILEGKAAHSRGNFYSVEKKPDGSRVTSVDLKSNEFLLEALSQLTPGVPIISEESPIDPLFREQATVWIIDPLDGTSSFIDGHNDFSVLLALVRDKRPILSVMYFPEKNILACAERGKGAYLNSQRLITPKNSFTEFRRQGIILRHLISDHEEYVYPHTIDSGMAFFQVAQGLADAFLLKMVTHKEWDIAAPTLILEESGAKITDERGYDLTFNFDELPWSVAVSSLPLAHEDTLKFLSQCR